MEVRGKENALKRIEDRQSVTFIRFI